MAALTIEGEFFQEAREAFNNALTVALVKMRQFGIEDGTVTLKLGIDLSTNTPAFTFEVKSKIKNEDKQGGIMRETGTELNWDALHQVFTITPAQPTLFESKT